MKIPTFYQVLLLGDLEHCQKLLKDELGRRMLELGLGSKLHFLDEHTVESRDRKAPLLAVFFGSPAHTNDSPLIAELIQDSIIIAPIVSNVTQVSAEVPPQLRHVNALPFDEGRAIPRIATLILEAFRLLRRERKLFISYKRTDSQPLANLLYDALDARGFDVFIDVRSVPPAADFQAELWHRMSDSDVVVLVDTPGFRSSRWTKEELATANATNIQILHLLWPGQSEDEASSFSHYHKLARGDFYAHIPLRGHLIKKTVVAAICDEAERLRARAIAARYRYLVDNFCDAARDLSLDPVVHPEQWISVDIRGRRLSVVPAIGVPTAQRINEIFEAIASTNEPQRDDLWIVYDNRGILNNWLRHLEWLDKHLPIRTIQMSSAPDRLRGMVT